MRVLLIFIDGVGIGRRDFNINPFSRIEPTIFAQFAGEPAADIYGAGLLRATDATLQVSGLPQSATGQTAIFTGVNASQLLGHHLSGFPNRALKEILARESIFAKLKECGRSATFANAYQPCFFTQRPPLISVTTAACLAAGVRLRTLEDLQQGDAVYQDFTHEYLRRIGYDVPLRTPEESGINLARIAARHDFTLYEYFITDIVGHAQDMKSATVTLSVLERFLRSVLDNIDPAEQLALLTSDHGNIEDLSHKKHTLNKIPTIGWGYRAREVVSAISSIQDITPTLVALL